MAAHGKAACRSFHMSSDFPHSEYVLHQTMSEATTYDDLAVVIRIVLPFEYVPQQGSVDVERLVGGKQ
jgi:hypothetical protein